jgi:hypothetical protein
MAAAASRRIVQNLSVDKVLASAVTFGCAACLCDAYWEGAEPLNGQLRAKGCSLRGDQQLDLSLERCQELERNGYLVIDNFLTKEQVQNAVQSLADDDDDKVFAPSQNERDGNQVRTDRIFFFKGGEEGEEKEGKDHNMNALGDVRNTLYRLGYDIVKSGFQGFPKDSKDAYQTGWLGVPAMMQISLYNKQGEDGAYYREHTDACDDTFLDLGLTGYLRSRYLRKRYLTCIVYLNPDWEPAHGGCLRITGNNNNNDKQRKVQVVDIEPRAGRLIIFSSVNTMHAVLPTFSRRLACSMWMTLNE